MAKEPVNPPSLFPSLNHGFSQGVVASGGRTLYISGQTGWNTSKTLALGGDLEGQARQAFENLEAVVEAAGGSLTDVVSLRIYIVDYTPDKAASVGGAFRRCFAGASAPSCTWIGVSALADPSFLIEVEGTAVLD